MLIFSRTVVF